MFGASVEEEGRWWSHVESITGDRCHGDMWQPGVLRKALGGFGLGRAFMWLDHQQFLLITEHL